MNEQPDKQKTKRVPTNAWKPGQSGNPKGRPLKGHSLTESLKEAMDEQPDIKKALIAKTVELALKSNDLAAIKMIWNYLDGMPTQNVSGNLDIKHDELRNPDALVEILGAAGFVPALGSSDTTEE